jgi:hypothetical protein
MAALPHYRRKGLEDERYQKMYPWMFGMLSSDKRREGGGKKKRGR